MSVVLLTSMLCLLFTSRPVLCQSGHTWTVGIDRNYAPHEYWVDGEAKGFNVDIINALAVRMGVEVSWVPLSWHDALEALSNGTVDSLCMARSAERDTYFDFSRPILNLSLRVFVRPEVSGIVTLEDLAGHTVAVEEGDIADSIVTERCPEANIVRVRTQDEAIQLVANGEVLAAFCNEYAGYYAVMMNDIDNVKVIGEPVDIEPRVIAVREGDRELLQAIDAALEELFESGEYETIFARWFGTGLDGNRELAQIRTLVVAVAGIVGAGVLLVLTWNWSLRRRVDRATRRILLLTDIFRHDLRNICQIGLYSLELLELKTDLRDGEAADFVENAKNAFRRLDNLINDLSLLETLASERPPKGEVDVKGALYYAAERLRAEQVGVDVQLIFESDRTQVIHSCELLPEALFRVMRYVAVKTQPDGGRYIIVRVRRTRLHTEISIGSPELVVPPDMRENRFLRYAGDSHAEVGLDLSVAHSIVSQCGKGTIRVEISPTSDEGTGATFVITLGQ